MNREKMKQLLLALSIIAIVTTYSNSFYNQILNQISSLFDKKYIKSLIQ